MSYLNLPQSHLYSAPPLGVIYWDFAEIFDTSKLESLVYRTALYA